MISVMHRALPYTPVIIHFFYLHQKWNQLWKNKVNTNHYLMIMIYFKQLTIKYNSITFDKLHIGITYHSKTGSVADLLVVWVVDHWFKGMGYGLFNFLYIVWVIFKGHNFNNAILRLLYFIARERFNLCLHELSFKMTSANSIYLIL